MARRRELRIVGARLGGWRMGKRFSSFLFVLSACTGRGLSPEPVAPPARANNAISVAVETAWGDQPESRVRVVFHGTDGRPVATLPVDAAGKVSYDGEAA